MDIEADKKTYFVAGYDTKGKGAALSGKDRRSRGHHYGHETASDSEGKG